MSNRYSLGRTTRLRYSWLLLVAFLFSYSSWAQVTVTVGSGTATATTVPVSTNWGFNYSQQIYTAAQINGAIAPSSGPQTISQLAFFYNTAAPSTAEWASWDIYLGNTTQNSFASTTNWIPGASLTQVFSGTVTAPAAGNWMTITLTTPFLWDGTSNLVVAVDENSPGFASANAAWGTFTSGTNTGMYFRNYTTNPNPASPPTASLQVSSINRIRIQIPSPPSCTAITNGGTVSPSSLTACPGNSFTLNVTGATADNPGGITWQWQSSTNGVDFSNISGQTGASLTTSVTAATWFRRLTICAAGSSELPSTAVQVNVSPALSVPTTVENFTATTLPSCWSTALVTGTVNWASQVGTTDNDGVPSGRGGGGRFLGKPWNNSDALAVSPQLNFASATPGSMRVNVWIYRNTVNAASDRIRLHINTAPNLTGATQLLEVFPNTTVAPTVPSAGWYNYTANIPASFTGIAHIIVQGTTSAGFSSYGIGLDDLVIEPIPSCLQPTALNAGSITSTSASLSWTAGGTETAWNVQYGTAGFTLGSGTIVSATSPYALGSLTPETSYDFYVQADCGGAGTSPWAGPFTFFTGYCLAGTTNATTFISNFTTTGGFTNINNTSGAGAGGYTNFSSLSLSANDGTAIGFTINATDPSDPTVMSAIYVDWNNDLDFSDPGESVFTNGTSFVNPNVGSFTIPGGTPNGSYRMRIRINWDGSALPACGSVGRGEVEDYTINVVEPPACLPPSAAVISNIGSTSAQINWTENGTATTWEIQYGPAATTTLGTGLTISGINALPYTISGLTASTAYSVWYRSDCGAEQSTWAGPVNFTTAPGCGSVFTDPAGASAPYADNSNYLVTIFPDSPGQFVRATFTSFSTEGGFDGLQIFNGPTTASPQISSGAGFSSPTAPAGSFSGTTSPGIVTSTDPSGALTFLFTSDAPFFGSNTFAGWVANITCINACAGTPNAGVATAPASVCDGVGFTLNATGVTIDLGISYQWEVSTNGGANWTAITGGTTIPFTATQSVASDYRLVSTCANGGATATSNVVSVGMNAPLSCYCIPTVEFGCADGDVIAQVTLNTLNNNTGTGCPSDPTPGSFPLVSFAEGPGYSNYTDFSLNPNWTTQLAAGGTFGCQVFAGQFSQNYAAWIDYNDNGIFETSERIGFTTSAVLGSGSVGVLGSSATFPVVLACNPPLGFHRLRIRSQFGVASGAAITPCGAAAFGETEDYTIEITTPVPCPSVSGLTVGTVTATTAALSWNLGCEETEWDVIYGAPGFNPETAGTLVDEVSTLSTTVTGLSELTSYQAYVRADCSGDNSTVSAWFGPVSFTTPALPPANDNCENAIPITCASGTVNGTNVGATTSPGETTEFATVNNAVWYTLVGDGSQVTISTCGGVFYDNYIRVYSGSCGNYTNVTANDDFAGCGTAAQVTFSATSGVTYYILVSGLGTFNSGEFTMTVSCIAPPANDNCASAQPITCGSSVNGTSVAASVSTGEATAGVWYSIVGDGSTIAASTCGGATWNTFLEVLTGPCGGPYTTIASNNDACGTQSTVSFLSTTGVTYYVLVRGVGGATGTFTLSTTCQNICTTIQNPGAVLGPNTICSGVSFTLNATNINVGTVYQWQRRTAGTNWTNIAGATSSSLTTSQTVATEYRVRIGCNSSGLNSISTPLAVALTPFLDCYCTPTTGSNTGGDFIAAFNFGSITNNSGVNPTVYTNYTAAQFTTTVLRGGQHSGSFTVGTFGTNNVGIWIDFNRNGVFESTERVYNNTSNLAGSSTTPFTVNVPSTAALGTTKLRIRKNDVTSGGPGIDPCAAYSWTETEDYTITIANGSANDSRANATVVNPANFPSCSNLSGNLANATPSATGEGNDLWYSFIAESSGVRIQLTGSGDNLIELEDAAGNTVETQNTAGGNETLANGTLIPGAQYFVAVRNVTGPASFTVCIQTLAQSTCDNGPVFTSLCNVFKADWTGTANYVATFTETAAPFGVYVGNLNGTTSLPLRNVAGLAHGRSYNVRVDAVYNIGGEIITVQGDGLCTITITQHPFVNLRTIDAAPNTRTIGAFIGTDVLICGNTDYEWTFELVDNANNPIDPFNPPVSVFTGSNSRYIRTNQIPEVSAGNRYRVRVRPIFGAEAGVFDETTFRYLQITSSANIVEVFDGEVAPETILFERNTENGVFAALYPNPNNGDMVNLNIAGLDSESVQVRIFDATGRVVFSNRYVVEGALNTIVSFDNPLTSGMYIVEMTYGKEVITERMMVSK